MPLQSAQPGAQDDAGTEHWPAPHVVAPVTCARLVQSFVHVPQCRASVDVSTQLPLQLVWPVGHWHAPPTHTSPVGQAVPQALQLFESVCRFVQVPPQSLVPAGQPQLEPVQVLPPVHLAPHAPQLLPSLVMSTQAPLQSMKPVLQANEQALVTQAGTTLATVVVQALPQVLQLFALLDVSTHEVLHRVGVAAGQPDAQAKLLPDGAQTEAPPEHALPQPPQFVAVVMSTSQPSEGSPLQSAQPGAHEVAGRAH